MHLQARNGHGGAGRRAGGRASVLTAGTAISGGGNKRGCGDTLADYRLMKNMPRCGRVREGACLSVERSAGAWARRSGLVLERDGCGFFKRWEGGVGWRYVRVRERRACVRGVGGCWMTGGE